MLITYNHENYIAQALDSILMQKTEFLYEINVIEDCSTDNTQSIIMRYARSHPDIVKPFFNTINIGFTDTQKNFFRGFKTLTGTYFAILEGDDFWTSPHKIQTEVEFLKANPSFVICAHNTLKVYEDADRESHRFLYHASKDGDIDDVINLRCFFHNAGVMYRNVFKGIPPKHYSSRWSCDIFIMISHAQFGKIHHLDEDMAVYRAHAGGRFSTMPLLDGWMFNVEGLCRYNAWLRFRYLKSFSNSISTYSKYILTSAGKHDVPPLGLYRFLKLTFLLVFYGCIRNALGLPVWSSRQRTALLYASDRGHTAVHSSTGFRKPSFVRSTLARVLELFSSRPLPKRSLINIRAFGYLDLNSRVPPDRRPTIWMDLDSEPSAKVNIIIAGTRLTTLINRQHVSAHLPLRLVATFESKAIWLEVLASGGVEISDPIFFKSHYS